MDRYPAVVRGRKFLVTGTHSTGKSEALSNLAGRLPGRRLTVVTESARDCPLALNRDQNLLSTTWLFAAQLQSEIEAHVHPEADLVGCDRGVPDILAYHQTATGQAPTGWIADAAAEWLSTYELVFLASPDPRREPAADPLRVDDSAFRVQVQTLIEHWVATHCRRVVALPHSAERRLSLMYSALVHSSAAAT